MSSTINSPITYISPEQMEIAIRRYNFHRRIAAVLKAIENKVTPNKMEELLQLCEQNKQKFDT